MSDPASLLLLFDIDGTLLAGATRAHARALHEALREVHGIDPEKVSAPTPAGRTDGEIARLMLLAAGVAAERIDDRASYVRERSAQIYARLGSEDLSHTVIAGIPALLDRLNESPDVTLGLVTGNFEPIGRMKLRQAGIGGRFAGCPGGFGSDSENRASLPGIARRRAGTSGLPHPRERTVVIGDTPRDIACARADGVRCIAVTTGPHAASDLSEADGVAADSSELNALLNQL